MQTSSPNSVKPPEPKSILLIGPHGSGKTTLALQFPKVHVSDCDRMLDGPELFLRTKLKDLAYSYTQVTLKDGVPVPVEECFQKLLDDLDDAKKSDAKTVFVDGLSLVNQFLIQMTLKKQRRETMEMRDWGSVGGHYANLFIVKVRNLGKTTIFSCHEEPVEKASAQNPMVKEIIRRDPIVNGGIKHQLGGFFTDIWRCSSMPAPGGGIEFKINTCKTTMDDLKNSMMLPDEIVIKKGELAWTKLEPYMKGLV